MELDGEKVLFAAICGDEEGCLPPGRREALIVLMSFTYNYDCI
jgi:hypothetical protein